MSLSLAESNIGWVKTGFTHTEPSIHYFEIGDAHVEMSEGAEAIKKALFGPVISAEVAAKGLKEWISTMRPAPLPENSRQIGEIFTPHPGVEFPDFSLIRSEEPVEILGYEVTARDFFGLTHYFMTNTSVEGPSDPRLALVEECKANL